MFDTTILVGNLGRDPEMRYTPSGTAVCDFSVAVNRSFTNSRGERQKQTIWYRISAWGKLAETCNQYLTKGSKVLVEGRLNSDENGNPKIWNRNDGSPAASFEITASTVRFLSTNQDGEAGEAEQDVIPF